MSKFMCPGCNKDVRNSENYIFRHRCKEMTRSEKIEALADSVYPKMHPAWDGEQRTAYVDGILAGIALRDAELLERLVTFDDVAAFNNSKIDAVAFESGAEWQHEQFMKILKGET